MPKTSILPKMNRFVATFIDIRSQNTETFRQPACTAYSIKTSLFSRKGSLWVISTSLPNHLIRLDQHVLWYHQAKLLRGFKVDENLEF